MDADMDCDLPSAECILCKRFTNEEDLVTLREKGCAGINRASKLREDILHATPGQAIHKQCRLRYTKPQEITKAARGREDKMCQKLPARSLRSSFRRKFCFKKDCLFCGASVWANLKQKKTASNCVRSVQTLTMKDKIMKVCNARNDTWSEAVLARLLSIHDLHAAKAMYHQVCSVRFRTKKRLPAKCSISTAKSEMQTGKGRPEDEVRKSAFIAVTKYIEDNDDEQISIGDLIVIMQEYLDGTNCEAYGRTHMKEKLFEHFSNRIIVTEVNGKPNIVTLRSTVDSVLQEYYSHSKECSEDAKSRIIRTAAKLIKDDVKSIKTSADKYPAFDDRQSVDDSLNYLPESLRLLLSELFVGRETRKKKASIGQAIMQAIRPRVLLAPLQIGLGIQMQHHFGSRFLIDTLNSHGFCTSYKEVKKFQKNAAVHRQLDVATTSSSFIQYIADNVDHNSCTLDGKNTFHEMGIIAAMTPEVTASDLIPRINVSMQDIRQVGRIQIHFHERERNGARVPYEDMINFKAFDATSRIESIWKMSLLVQSPRPAWSGMMQAVHRGSYPGKSSVIFMPMIDMNPTDESCIYSTLNYICEHAKRYNVTPVVTFDQPLWWKAHQIIVSEPQGSPIAGIVLRLGGLHLQMSFLGSVGHLMAGSGLRELMEKIYAQNTVDHILNGKAVARAIRAHLILDAALNTIMASTAYNIPLTCLQFAEQKADIFGHDATFQFEDHGSNACNSDLVDLAMTVENFSETRNDTEIDLDMSVDEDSAEEGITLSLEDVNQVETQANHENSFDYKKFLDELGELYNNLMSGIDAAEDICKSAILDEVEKKLKDQKAALKRSRTAALWIQYMEMIEILKKFIKAERLGNWELHLQATSDMLPYFAASGHNQYAKSARIYLQQMAMLPEKHPDVYLHFQDGLHVVRRSDRQWAGLSTDLVIEQVLMRSLKSTGGLTRGSGLSEHQRNVWLLSMPSCAQVNRSMQDVMGTGLKDKHQNKDLSISRQLRDFKDTCTIVNVLLDRNPFSIDCSLRNIVSGVTAHQTVNVDHAKDIGFNILHGMTGKNALEHSFKKSEQAITLATKEAVKIDGEKVPIDPHLLFQRLVIAAKQSEDVQKMFRFEMCSYPSSLFDASLSLRSPNKPVLADALWSLLSSDLSEPAGELHYVLDGGALLHRIPWPRGEPSYEQICSLYTNYVAKKYGTPTVVFDGYGRPSTKDMTHIKRAGNSRCPTVNFRAEMQLTMKKEEFLSNAENKQRFIHMLDERLRKKGCRTYHADGDADLLIVQVAIHIAEEVNTIVVGDDTDLIVLLLYHSGNHAHDIFFRPEPKFNKSKTNRLWNLKVVREQLGTDLCRSILFLHAILGCDTTSHPFGLNKGSSVRKHMQDNIFRQQANVFNSDDSSPENVIEAGENALVCLYGGSSKEKLDELRYKKFCEKAASKKTQVQPQTLPPTSAAAKYHSLRVYYQVQQWKGCSDEMSPEQWGWLLKEGTLVPRRTDLPAAPADLLRVIRCNCKQSCDRNRCSCRRNNLDCTNLCGNCRGITCSNSSKQTDCESSDDEDENFDDSEAEYYNIDE